MTEQQQSKFEGWAVVEMMGHQTEVGYVTTEYFGGAAMFRVDSPDIPAREYELERPQWVSMEDATRLAGKGTKVKLEGIPAHSRLVSPGALYAITPCTEEAARKAYERSVRRQLIVIDFKEDRRALPATPDEGDESQCDCRDDEYCDRCFPPTGKEG
ncbi:MAG TPA: hypothetical protein VN622_08940 [Clostridia bacterium]|nr:hypothetical protein [Clostridia bacterium]